MKTNHSAFAILALSASLALAAVAPPAAAQSWIQLAPAGALPPGRSNGSSVYDPTTDTLILFGGDNCGPNCQGNDVWILSHADGLGGTPAWTQLFPTGGPPSARQWTLFQSIYDPATNRMVIFGGDPAGGYCGAALSDVWVLTHANGQGGQPQWLQLNPVGGPVQIRDASAVYDPTTNRMIVFGGDGGACIQTVTNNVWVLSNANGLGGTPTWTQLAPAGGPVPAQEGQFAVYDPGSNRMAVYGGSGASGVISGADVWILSNANGLGGTPTWTQFEASGVPPDPRSGFSGAYDSSTNSMIIFGGYLAGSGALQNDLWVLHDAIALNGTPSWLQLSPTGTLPSARLGANAVFDPSSDRMTLFGGLTIAHSVYTFLNDTWATGIAPFSTFTGKLDISSGPPPGFDFNGDFTLEAGQSINPLTQTVSLQVGTYSVTIPSASFVLAGNGSYAFQGTINGVVLQVQIAPRKSAGEFSFKVDALGADLTRLTNPVTVTVSLGINSGSTSVTADFGD